MKQSHILLVEIKINAIFYVFHTCVILIKVPILYILETFLFLETKKWH